MRFEAATHGLTGPQLWFRLLRSVGAVALATIFLCGFASQARAFGIDYFDGEVIDPSGAAYTRAGGHPYEAVTQIKFPTKIGLDGRVIPDGHLRNLEVDLPAGFIGNAMATPRCPQATYEETGSCPADTQVGVAFPEYNYGIGESPLYNLEPSPGAAAEFGFRVVILNIHLVAELRPNDNGVRIRVQEASQQAPKVQGSIVRFWGTPADPRHDAARGGPTQAPRIPLLTNPTSCVGPVETTARADSWEEPGILHELGFFSHLGAPNQDVLAGNDSCNQVPFSPGIKFQPTSTQADAPTGLDVEISVPSSGLLNPDGISQSALKKAVVTLPEGMSVNPSSADGLGSCSPAQLAAETATSAPGAGCPESAKIGTVAVTTPLLAEQLQGSIYLAKQNDNPFNSLLALYVVIKSPDRGVAIKLAGRIDPDPTTGRLVASFDDNPQLPFTSLSLHFKSGNRSALINPPTCGTHTIQTELTPWSGNPPLKLSETFEVSSGPNGGPCPVAGQFDPGFEAGTVTPIAGAYSPLVVKASLADGSQVLRGLSVDLPPGLTGKLQGIPYCSQASLDAAAAKSGTAELASPSCPAASRVGSVDVGAGAGSTPFHVGASAYLAGPYKGAPLSLAVLTPAVAGPFDLGTVVVRVALQVDPGTARITATSDPIPTILQGIPLHVRSVTFNTDRPEFTLNPTSCNPFSLAGTLVGTSSSKAVSSRFQVGACGALAFKPKLSMRFSGAPPRRGGFPALKAVVSAGAGQANIGKTAVLLPGTELLEQNHIRTICTRDQWAADACPPASVYGKAKAITPLLDQPLEGPVYLRANGGARELPDLVADLRGQIDIELAGYIDTVVRNGVPRMRTRFLSVPDAPVTRFVLEMQGGRKGLLANNTNLCKAKPRASVSFDGQNGKTHNLNPLVAVAGCGRKGK
jgi:hypothetical protein